MDSQCVHRSVTSETEFFLAVPECPDGSQMGQGDSIPLENGEVGKANRSRWGCSVGKTQEEGQMKGKGGHRQRSIAEQGWKTLDREDGQEWDGGWEATGPTWIVTYVLPITVYMTSDTSFFSPSLSFLTYEMRRRRDEEGGLTNPQGSLPPLGSPMPGGPLSAWPLGTAPKPPQTSRGSLGTSASFPRCNYPLHGAALYQAGALAALL